MFSRQWASRLSNVNPSALHPPTHSIPNFSWAIPKWLDRNLTPQRTLIQKANMTKYQIPKKSTAKETTPPTSSPKHPIHPFFGRREATPKKEMSFRGSAAQQLLQQFFDSQQSLSTFSSTTFWHYLLWIFFLLCYFFALSLCTFLFCLFYFGFCPTTYRRHHLLRQHTSN